jgi:hypothetical protein
MKEVQRNRVRVAVGVLSALGFIGALYFVYRWAEPSPRDLFAPRPQTNPGPALLLKNVPFVAVLDGVVNWSLHADRVEVYALPGVSLNGGVQNATIVGIRNGKLYQVNTATSQAPSLVPTHPPATTPLVPSKPPVASFSADQGSYSTLVDNTALPIGLQTHYYVRWQFRLEGHVQVKMQRGEQLTAPSITLLQLMPRPFGNPKLLAFCHHGATLLYKNAQIKVAQLRFDPQTRTADCQNGVEFTLLNSHETPNIVRSDSAFWALNDQTLRFPNGVTGTWQGIQFASRNIAVDIKHQLLTGLDGGTINADLQTLLSDAAAPPLSKPDIKGVGLEVKPMPIQILRPSSGKTAIALLALASTAAAPPTAKPTQNTSKVPFTLTWTGPWSDSAKTSTRIVHNFVYKEKDFTLSGDDLVWNYKTDQIDATGHLTYDSPQYFGSCNRAHLDDKAHQDVFEGNVVLKLKPKPSTSTTNKSVAGASNTPANTNQPSDTSANDIRSHGVTLYCDRVVEDTQTKVFILTGNLHAVQSFTDSDGKPIERNLTAAYAKYNDTTQQLTLYPPIDYKDNQGTTAHFDTPIVIGTKEGEETISGVGGTIEGTREEEETSTSSQSGSSPSSPMPPSPAKGGNKPPSK